jgi:hypothetical protein
MITRCDNLMPGMTAAWTVWTRSNLHLHQLQTKLDIHSQVAEEAVHVCGILLAGK